MDDTPINAQSAAPGERKRGSRTARLLRASVFRLTLLHAALFGASVLVLFAVVYWSAASFMTRQMDAGIRNELAEVRADAGGGGLPALQRVVADLTLRSPGHSYLLEDKSGAVLAGNMAPIAPVPGLRRLRGDDKRGGIRGIGETVDGGAYLFVGLSDFDLNEMREAVARAFLAGLGLTLALGLGGGLLLSLGLLRRIEAMSQASRDIMEGDLGRRIPLRGSDDEFDHLAGSLNAMLDRIQALMEGLKLVSSDIAHDLRTPLTRLRQRLELARLREHTVTGLHAALDGVLGDVDAILDTFAALLRIAQIEAGTRRSGFAAVNLSELLESIAETYQAVAEESGHTLTARIAPDLSAQGDRELLTQLMANLIENAISHTPPGTAIAVEGAAAFGVTRLTVADTGPGIPAEHRARVLRRFARLETSRTTPGSGLGLSLAASVAALHGATLALSDNQPGLRVTLDLPMRRRASS